ncbi:MAG: hypothetical protein A2266_00720 [Bacteroidetes bacterium RIFOXYA12_FULL_40_10]|jgi:hypothetical protein|nr:MAG: hypothetical protein A2266_00720 [Bacteroidetes bacterium RIFOXYA12_FULL_40_10]HBG24553.1 hypothetical protein [Rikenellaceae bacterium]
MNPSRLALLYHLLELYTETDQKLKNTEICHMILNYKSRYEGSFAIRVKNKASALLKENNFPQKL